MSGLTTLSGEMKGRTVECVRPEPFGETLQRHGLELRRGQTATLQVNMGYLCNLSCRHCHLSAGPGRAEAMTRQTADEVIAYAERGGFAVVDITGGAPELNPNLERLITGVKPFVKKTIVRSNLTLFTGGRERLPEFFAEHGVVIATSLPSVNKGQTDAQRGDGVFERVVGMIKRLNSMGYGVDGSGLELNLVMCPSGAFLPQSQEQTERRFRDVLDRDWGIRFNNLHAFANVPVGRFGQWLDTSGNRSAYIKKLTDSFNPCAVEGLMCRSLVSVSWDGYLYDCDFNLAEGLFMGGVRTHVSQMKTIPESGNPIAMGDHCYTCSAGAGFT
jgi:radical SAM/Cys-rich protein